MNPKRTIKANYAQIRQRGYAVVLALVLIVFLGLMGIFMLTTSGTQQMTTALSQKEMQAWFAAQSGLDWAIYQAVVSGTCTSPTFTLSGGAAASYSVQVSCAFSSVTETPLPTYNMFTVTATGSTGNPADPVYASRGSRATIADLP